MTRARTAFGVVVLVAAVGCDGNPAVSDTGYTGTWSRGTDQNPSIISIAKIGDEHRFRWDKRTADSRLRVACDWDGHCEEFFEGTKVADYRFRTWLDAKTGHLFVEAFETRTAPTTFEQRFTDELVLEPGGTVLWSYTIERDGEKFALGKGPRRSFNKIGDGIIDPPRGTP